MRPYFQSTKFLFYILIISLLAACREEIQKTKPEDYFTQSQKNSLLDQIVKKTTKKPEGLQSESEIVAYYSNHLKTYQWHFAHARNGGFYYFVSRPMPSLYGKRAGLGGYFQTSDHLSITGFKEVFHTFKMKPDILFEKGSVLFTKMVNQEDLSSYEPEKKENEEWIEFPDQLNRYDSASQSWKTRIQ